VAVSVQATADAPHVHVLRRQHEHRGGNHPVVVIAFPVQSGIDVNEP
jgi:hypothetical protein